MHSEKLYFIDYLFQLLYYCLEFKKLYNFPKVRLFANKGLYQKYL